MLSGTCAGVTGSGDCIRSGWSPFWLPPVAFAAQVDGLLANINEIVCPFCIVERAVGNVPGFNRAKANRVFAFLDNLHCLDAAGSRAVGHTHLFDFVNEQLDQARATPPSQSERGY
jgi:hypothetical protein